MSSFPPNSSLTSVSPGPQMLDSFAAAEEQHVDLVQLVRRLFYGRVHYAVILGLIGLIIGGTAGYMSSKPMYRSRGVVHIAPELPRVLFKTDVNEMMPRFDSYINGQASLITNQQVLTSAIRSDTWKKTGRTHSDEEAMKLFLKSLTVELPRMSEYIYIYFEDENPKVAAAAVESVLDAYQAQYRALEQSGELDRSRKLEDRRTALNNQLRSLRERIAVTSGDMGVEGYRNLFNLKMLDLRKLEENYGENKAAIAAAQVAQTQTTPIDLVPEVIAMYDGSVRDALRMRNIIRSDIENLKLRFGSGHRMIVDAQNRLDQADQTLAKLTRDYATTHPISGNANTPVVSLEILKSRNDQYEKNLTALKLEIAEMAKSSNLLQTLQDELEQTSKKLEAASARTDEISLESASITGRLGVIPAETPLSPDKDTRKKLAIAGGLGGMALGVGIIMLIGYFDRSMKNLNDARSTVRGIPMLGVLPMLPDDVTDPEQAALAAHSVHHIRILLQIGQHQGDKRVFVVTSPAAETGKTSLTLSLGLSFAASGSRTLLIDFDTVGGGLSSRVNTLVRRRIGNILQRGGLVSEEQLEAALAASKKSKKRLGETMVDMGFLAADDVAQAIAIQKESKVGLFDVLAGEDINHCITNLAMPDLFILPLGNASGADASKLSPKIMARILEQARNQFDVVVIDTGPVPGSIPAATAATQADGVVLVVSRGQDKTATERAIEHLMNIGARITGMVFNRANTHDLDPNSHAASRPDQGMQAAAMIKGNNQDVDNSSQFGPMARSVVIYTKSIVKNTSDKTS